MKKKNPPIICFEGPSGIGKTTMSHLLSSDFNIVPEVNLLFQRAENEPKYWYYERQIDRYEMCQQSNTKSILDGDIFQPIWYNWVCSYPAKFLSKEETHEFYRTQLAEGRIAFPDLYIIFHVDEKELWIRKEADKTRRRRNFEKHLKIIEPLKEYWRFLDKETDLEMRFIHYTDIATTQQNVLAAIENLGHKKVDGLKVFKQIEGWLDLKGETILNDLTINSKCKKEKSYC